MSLHECQVGSPACPVPVSQRTSAGRGQASAAPIDGRIGPDQSVGLNVYAHRIFKCFNAWRRQKRQSVTGPRDRSGVFKQQQQRQQESSICSSRNSNNSRSRKAAETVAATAAAPAGTGGSSRNSSSRNSCTSNRSSSNMKAVAAAGAAVAAATTAVVAAGETAGRTAAAAEVAAAREVATAAAPPAGTAAAGTAAELARRCSYIRSRLEGDAGGGEPGGKPGGSDAGGSISSKCSSCGLDHKESEGGLGEGGASSWRPGPFDGLRQQPSPREPSMAGLPYWQAPLPHTRSGRGGVKTNNGINKRAVNPRDPHEHVTEAVYIFLPSLYPSTPTPWCYVGNIDEVFVANYGSTDSTNVYIWLHQLAIHLSGIIWIYQGNKKDLSKRVHYAIW